MKNIDEMLVGKISGLSDMIVLHFCKPERNKLAFEILQELAIKYECIGFGKDRICFRMKGGYILKFPRHETGEYCNDGEASWKDETFAKGRYVEYKGFVCVIQEPLDITGPFLDKSKLPDWVYGIDCCQVGYSRDGTLKAYDFVHA
jgi:hypothetical protein